MFEVKTRQGPGLLPCRILFGVCPPRLSPQLGSASIAAGAEG